MEGGEDLVAAGRQDSPELFFTGVRCKRTRFSFLSSTLPLKRGTKASSSQISDLTTSESSEGGGGGGEGASMEFKAPLVRNECELGFDGEEDPFV